MNKINKEENMDNTWVHWKREALKFYKNNNIRVVNWQAWSTDFNPIKIVWA